MEAPSEPLAPAALPGTTPGTPNRSRHHEPGPEERALADKIATTATRLRDAAQDDGLSIREAIELATIQIGATR